MTEPNHEFFPADGLQLHMVRAVSNDPAANSRPPVVLCHGMPGLWYSWRHQLAAIAAAGFHAFAIDQRGYGRSDRPRELSAYSSTHTVQDLLCLLDYLGAEQGIFIGQDFGAAQVYNLAIRYPQRVAAVVGMACPYDFDFSGRGGAGRKPGTSQAIDRAFARPDMRPSECFAAIAEHQFFYAHYYQQPGPAEQELAGNPATFLRRLFFALSGEGRLLDWTEFPSDVSGYIDVLAEPSQSLPWRWMSEADLQYYVDEFMQAESGLEFIGGLSAYRVADINWDLAEPFADHTIEPPSLFIAGAKDPVITMIDPNAFDVLRKRSADLRGIHLIAGAGHFVQLERADECNRHIVEFLAGLQ